MLHIVLFPDAKERPRYPKQPAGLADVAVDGLGMLQHAQRGLDLPCLDLLTSLILYPDPPALD